MRFLPRHHHNGRNGKQVEDGAEEQRQPRSLGWRDLSIEEKVSSLD
jgi:hypothetical protein